MSQAARWVSYVSVVMAMDTTYGMVGYFQKVRAASKTATVKILRHLSRTKLSIRVGLIRR